MCWWRSGRALRSSSRPATGSVSPDPLDALRTVVNQLRLVSEPAAWPTSRPGSFPMISSIPRSACRPRRRTTWIFPDFVFWVPEQIVVLDHVHRSTTILAHVVGGARNGPSYHDGVRAIEAMSHAVAVEGGRSESKRVESPSTRFDPFDPLRRSSTPFDREPDLDDAAYAALVERLRHHIVAGDVFQIVPFTDVFPALRRSLRGVRPSPRRESQSLHVPCRAPDFTLLGASPETAVKVTGRPRTVVLRPIAGTAPRGRNARRLRRPRARRPAPGCAHDGRERSWPST